MVERREHLRLALESREAFAIAGERVGQDLDRDLASELGVARAIHLAHPAGAERRNDLVRTELVPAAEVHWDRHSSRNKKSRPLANAPAWIRRGFSCGYSTGSAVSSAAIRSDRRKRRSFAVTSNVRLG